MEMRSLCLCLNNFYKKLSTQSFNENRYNIKTKYMYTNI